MTQDVLATYDARFPALERVAKNLTSLLHEHLAEMPRIDRVSSRAKGKHSFAAKAGRLDPEGKPRYEDPLAQIQDQVAARVIVFYKSDVDLVADIVAHYFQPIEWEDRVPESDWEFGYFGRHWVLALPDDVIPGDVDRSLVPRFFELQVRTLFQHAWSEASHDLAYKPPEKLSSDQRRRFAYTAAHAWGADRVLEDLWRELDPTGGDAARS
ncbi:MAG: RelA/SpoT domain-containing protein [Gemmatimonadetes bacterium]|nr:RelA/SpoT domain-containing protein [Gemmatimonadota bacterium]